LFGHNTARVAFKRNAYLRHFVLDFAGMLSERLDQRIIHRALEGKPTDFGL
jgi:LysR family cys regulon transcriptional activator